MRPRTRALLPLSLALVLAGCGGPPPPPAAVQLPAAPVTKPLQVQQVPGEPPAQP